MGKVYILCPGGTTGGIELLHQLCYKLRLFGYDAYIYYVGADGNAVVPEVYRKYNISVTYGIDDTSENIVVFPEIYIPYINQIKNSKRILWWLSVDNARGTEEEFDNTFSDKTILHFSQSKYATEMLIRHGVSEKQIFWLCDYINSEFLHLKPVPDENKDNVVLFNPKKGFQKTSSIIEMSNGNVKWQALSGFTPSQMRNVMQHAKVYIDFGNHPGRDRIPREATMCGCCLITNLEGAAANSIDVAIDNKYKFNNDTSADRILAVIYDLIEKYEDEKINYQSYCQRTAREFMSFETDLLYLFEMHLGSLCPKMEQSELKQMILSEVQNDNYRKAFLYIVKYRLLKYEEDLDFYILEANVRIGIGEFHEAEYIIKLGLEKASDNYELYYLWGRALLGMNTVVDILESLKMFIKTIELCKGTEDEEYLTERCLNFINNVNERYSSR